MPTRTNISNSIHPVAHATVLSSEPFKIVRRRIPWAGILGYNSENCVASESFRFLKNLSSEMSP